MRSRSRVMIAVALIVLVIGLVGCSGSKKSSTDLGLKDGKKTSSGAAESSSSVKGAGKAGVVPITDSESTGTVVQGAPGVTADDGTPGSATGGTGNAGNTGGTGSTGTSNSPAPVAQGGVTVRILWWNDTVSKSPGGFEVVYGGSSYKPDTTKRKGVGTIAHVPTDKTIKLLVYPDGRGSSVLPKRPLEFTVEFSPEMTPDSDADAIHIAVSDGKVQVLGNPIPNFSQVLAR